MAAMSAIVQSMMDEFGKSALSVRKKVERLAGEAVLDLLSQNNGQFVGLQKTQDITLAANATTSRLPPDFNTAQKTFIEVDSSGDFVAERAVVTQQEFYRRKADADYAGTGYTMIETKQISGTLAGDYLVWDTSSTSERYFKFFYYRVPLVSDIHLIKNQAVIKQYIRGNSPEYVPEAGAMLQAYYGMRKHIIENPQARTKTMQMKPSKHIQKHNRFMRTIGGGG